MRYLVALFVGIFISVCSQGSFAEFVSIGGNYTSPRGSSGVQAECGMNTAVKVNVNGFSTGDDFQKLIDEGVGLPKRQSEFAQQSGVKGFKIDNYNYSISDFNRGGYRDAEENSAYRMTYNISLSLDSDENVSQFVELLKKNKMRASLNVSSRNTCR